MRCKILLGVAIGMLLCSAAWAQDNPAPRTRSDSLSTRLGGLDTLGVVPTEVMTPYQGGTRRIELEGSVFRREEPVAYSPDGRRDPFRALIVDGRHDGEIHTDLLIVDGANLTGVVWAEAQSLATVLDKQKRSFFLREGDQVYRGRVTNITQTSITFEIYDFGQSRSVTLHVND